MSGSHVSKGRDKFLILGPGGKGGDLSYDCDNLNVKIIYWKISFFRIVSLFINLMMRYFIVLHTLGKHPITVALAKSLERALSMCVKPNFPEYSNLTKQSTVCRYTARRLLKILLPHSMSHIRIFTIASRGVFLNADFE